MIRISKECIIEINKRYSDGSLRYDGSLDNYLELNVPIPSVAEYIIKGHPFTDGNKRTAIRLMELYTKEKVPEYVYELLEEI